MALKILKKFWFLLLMIFSNEVIAKSLNSILKKASQNLSSMGLAIGTLAFIWVGYRYKMGDSDAKEKAKNAFIGSFFIFGGSAIMKFLSSWF